MDKLLSKTTKKLSAGLALMCLLLSALFSNVALAMTDEERMERQNAKTKVPEARVGKKVTEAFDLYGQELVEESLQVLLEIKSSKAYDMAFVNKFIGNIYATLDDKLAEAIKYSLMAYETDVLNYKEQGETINLLGQLYMMNKDYANAIDMYRQWMDFTGKQDHKVYIRIANAHYELKQLDKVIAPANKAIELMPEPETTPYVLKLASYFERKMFPDTVKIGEILVKLFPEEKRNWVQLGMFYVMVEDYTKGLSMMEMAYKQGFLEKSNEFKTLAQMYSQNELPIKAATVQEKYIKLGVMKRSEQNLKSLANYFMAAKEMNKAAQYFGEAAKDSEKAFLYRRQGEMLFQAEKYGQAVVALQKALDKDVAKQGGVHLTMMQAYFHQGKYKNAYASLKKADKYPKARGQVRSWRQYIIDKAGRNGVKL